MRANGRRWPLWTAFLPLIVGVTVWAIVWRGYAATFEADLRRVLPETVELSVGGFPYRLEARARDVRLAHRDAALDAMVSAEAVAVNRVPWQRARQVVNLEQSVTEVALRPVRVARVRVEAAEAQASLRLDGRRIARLSGVWREARIATGLFDAPVTAASFEAHLRETPAEGQPGAGGGRLPTQAQLNLAAEGLVVGGGDPMQMRLATEVTAARAVTSLAGWQRDGTVELVEGTLADVTGEVARMRARLTPAAGGAIAIAGTVETVCPASVRAALTGGPPVAEQRVRRPQTVRFEGPLGGPLAVSAAEPGPPAPVRGQLPPCPRIR